MVRYNEIRDGEITVDPPAATDAGLVFIGRIRTPWTDRMMTPRQGRHDGPLCRLEIFEPWWPALKGLDQFTEVEVLYWLHESRRDLVHQSPASDGKTRGTFALRSPFGQIRLELPLPNSSASRAGLCSCEGSIVSTARR